MSTLFGGITAEDLIAEEQERQTADLSTPSTLGKRTSPSGDSDSDRHEDEEEEPAIPRGESLPSHSTSATHPNPGSLQMEQVIRRTAKRLKLPNEDISLVETFAQEPSLDVRLVLLYGSTIAVRNELAELRRDQGATSYQIGDELEDNIKKYSRLVLLSPSIYHYKGKMPKEYLTKIVIQYRFGIPQKIEANGHAWAKITTCIDHELTQARGALKKIIQKDAKQQDAQYRLSIYQLARTMAKEETYKISPAVCTRVAIMRELYKSYPGGNFWDEVDKFLDTVKAMPEEQRFIYLKAILSRDRRAYGTTQDPAAAVRSEDAATAGEESLIQQRIEDFIEGPSVP